MGFLLFLGSIYCLVVAYPPTWKTCTTKPITAPPSTNQAELTRNPQPHYWGTTFPVCFLTDVNF